MIAENRTSKAEKQKTTANSTTPRTHGIKMSTRSISIWMDNGTKREKIAEKCFFIFTNQSFCDIQMAKSTIVTNYHQSVIGS